MKYPPSLSMLACCLLPVQVVPGGQRPLPAWTPGHGWERLLPWHGTWHRDSCESGNTGAGGPDEDDGGPVLIAASLLLLLLFLPRCLLGATQHPELVQGQAELGTGWCPVCREERQAGSWRWPGWVPRGQSPVSQLPLAQTLVHRAPRWWGLGRVPGCPCSGCRGRERERQLGSGALTAAWR